MTPEIALAKYTGVEWESDDLRHLMTVVGRPDIQVDKNLFYDADVTVVAKRVARQLGMEKDKEGENGTNDEDDT